jgi:uncharacterized membrane protein YhiD involved in acid resistance
MTPWLTGDWRTLSDAPWTHLGLAIVSIFCGAIIGSEREKHEKAAGLRTVILVSLGSCAFTMASFIFESKSGDSGRVAAQIVTGIGFLGAGAIIREGLSIRGLTTAATLWVVAAIGMACGAGYYWPAAGATLLTILALWPLRILAYHTVERMRPEENRLTIELKGGEPVAPLLAAVGEVRHFELTEELDRRVVLLELPDIDEDLVARLSDLDYVIGVRWHR